MKRIATSIFILAFANTVNAQKIYTSDITNFWAAYDSIQKTNTNKVQVLENLFLSKKTDGLNAFMNLKKFNEVDYLDVIEKYPQFWNSIRPNTLISAKKTDAIRKALQQLNKLYPNHSTGNIYFTIGALKSGGTTNHQDLLLGIEKIVGDKNTVTAEFESKSMQQMFQLTTASQLEQVTVHEFIHTFQKDGEANVLIKAIKEGSCDFIAELAINKKFTSAYIDYGYKNYDAVKASFKKEMLTENFGNWFYNSATSEHPDLGYFVGYVISKKYYENAKDKKKAIKAIIELDFNNETAILEFVEKSGYFDGKINVEQIKSDYQNNQPKVVRLMEFENGNQNVNPEIKKIQVVFSKPMQDKISINFSKNGKEHFPLQNIVGLDESKTILTLETTDLKPNTEYDFYITNRGTQSRDGYPFAEAEYKIAFRTDSK